MDWNFKLAHKKKNTLWINFLIIFGTWIPFVFISILSNSITLIAQMLMGGAQSLSVYLSLLTTQKSVKKQENLITREVYNARLMAFIFLISFMVVSYIAVKRFFHPKPLGDYALIFGAIVNTAAVFVNYFQWKKNLKISKQEYSPLMESQWSLFRIKTFTTLTSVLSTAVYYILPQSFVLHRFVDPAFSLALAALILYSSIALFRKAKFGKEN